MANNYETDAGSGGKTFKSTQDGSTVDWPAALLALDGGGTPGYVDASNPVPISAASLPLPSGAATEATLASILSALGAPVSVSAAQSGTWNITNISGTISLPTGASTLAEQQTQTTALGTLALESGGNLAAILSALGGTLTISGSVTANAGTNLNTSALATEATLSTLNGKVTACNTGAVVISSGTITAVTAITNALPAGTNAIGKLAANSGVDIGDVDVTSLPAEVSGPGGLPTIDSYGHAAISASANTANQVVVSSAANKQIWVYGWGGTADTGDGSISFQDEDDTAISGVMPVAQKGGFSVPCSGNFAMPIWKLATDKDLEIDTVTCGFKGWISYAIVDVS